MKWSEISCPERNNFYGPYDDNEMVVRGWFLNSIGINLDVLPDELFEPCELISSEDLKLSNPYEARVDIRDIAGTKHTVYGGRTWIYAFIQQHKTLYHIKAGNVTRGKYFKMLKQPLDKQPPCISLIKAKNGRYYVYTNGNHRVTFYKLMYLTELASGCDSNKYWLYAEIRDEL